MDMITDNYSNRRINIFGTGKKAIRLTELLIKNGILPTQYVVSPGYNNADNVNGIKVVDFSQYQYDAEDILLVAVSEKKKYDIMELLNDKKCDYYYVTDDDLNCLCRETIKFDPKNFVISVDPVSRLFGLDRGQAIDRRYIEKFIEAESGYISEKVEKTIEVGETTYSELYFEKADRYTLDYSAGMDLTKRETLDAEKK